MRRGSGSRCRCEGALAFSRRWFRGARFPRVGRCQCHEANGTESREICGTSNKTRPRIVSASVPFGTVYAVNAIVANTKTLRRETPPHKIRQYLLSRYLPCRSRARLWSGVREPSSCASPSCVKEVHRMLNSLELKAYMPPHDC